MDPDPGRELTPPASARALIVEVRRGAHVESRHRVHYVVVRAADAALGRSAGQAGQAGHAGGRPFGRPSGAPDARDARDPPDAPSTLGTFTTLGTRGSPRLVSFVRSAIKMFQALPLVEDGGVEHFGLTAEELALTTASHNAEPFHVAAARSILTKAGVTDDELACGPHPPMHAPSAEAMAADGRSPGRIHNNCSGKHAGLIALARMHAWSVTGYHELAHPVQQRVLHTLAMWSDYPADEIAIAVDGCGLPTFALPLDRVALACARFAATANDPSSAAGRIFDAMTTHPEYVAGTGRLCTEVMRVAAGRTFAKVGAEGYYCAGIRPNGIGIALKVEDGAKRAAEPALLHVLSCFGGLDICHDALTDYARPSVTNTLGDIVGEIVVEIE